MSGGAERAAVQLNCDTGEAEGGAWLAAERAMLASVTAVNVACGGHAGDAETMRASVREAARAGCAVGAHPSYVDRAGFGREELGLGLGAVRAALAAQLAEFVEVCASEGVAVEHVKPHGAMYHRASSCEETAGVLGEVTREVVGAEASLVLRAGSLGERWCRAAGVRVLGEAFADRGYASDRGLVPRGRVGAVLGEAAAARQAVSIVTRGRAVAVGSGVGVGGENGETREELEVEVRAETVCVHADTPGAAGIARAVRLALEGAGVRVVARWGGRAEG